MSMYIYNYKKDMQYSNKTPFKYPILYRFFALIILIIISPLILSVFLLMCCLYLLGFLICLPALVLKCTMKRRLRYRKCRSLWAHIFAYALYCGMIFLGIKVSIDPNIINNLFNWNFLYTIWIMNMLSHY